MARIHQTNFLNSHHETIMQTPNLKYLKLLSEKYPSIQAASTAIINLSAELQLPKGTEHFLSDIHGENEAFQHVVRNGAGSILRKIDEMFGNTMSKRERRNLATLIYYPEQKTPLMLQSVPDRDEWCRLTLVRLVKFSRRLSAKYRRETVRNLLPKHVAETIEELLYDQEGVEHKAAYYQSQIDTIVSTGSATTFIVNLASNKTLPVNLYWHCWNLDSAVLGALSAAIIAAAGQALTPPRATG